MRKVLLRIRPARAAARATPMVSPSPSPGAVHRAKGHLSELFGLAVIGAGASIVATWALVVRWTYGKK